MREMSAETIEMVEQSDGLPGSIPTVLKKLMENPPPKFLDAIEEGKDKEKLSVDEVSSSCSASVGVSASLMPTIWDKTIPYDGEMFHLEYMDLDEFLLENGIPATLEQELRRSLGKDVEEQGEDSHQQEVSTAMSSPLLPTSKLEREETSTVTCAVQPTPDPVFTSEPTTEVESEPERGTPSPVDPEHIEVQVNFEPDPTDLVLSSVPGGELFNPRKHKFSDEELKPQPMIKKAKKVFVPEESKDEKYWSRRRKNNVAAKRSRDARRLKENQITVRAAFLEKENAALRAEVAELRRDFGRYKNIVARYQAKFGPLELDIERKNL
ncbi:thyrotroph embryonic factor-like isoform X1 [Polypterus senegalus]|nr:thyrotroph embryonic factor-like isoform X1 [Polypterus senegalus]